MESIVALAGRRIDLANANPERFPARNLERVRRAVQLKLRENRASWLVSSAAAGADLIGIHAAVDLGLHCRIVLSPNVEEFMHKSVEDRGPEWEKEFRLVLAATRADDIILVPECSADSDTFKAVNQRILSETIALALLTFSKPICIAAWEGVKREGEDFTADFIERAGALKIPVVRVSTV
jgi:hypothetical protein